MIISQDGELVLTPTDEFTSELEVIYAQAQSEFGGFFCSGAVMQRRSLRPGQGRELNPHKPENLEHLVLSVGTVTVGFVTLYRDFPGKSFVEILFMYISPAARRMGNGSRALQALSSFFSAAGYGSMRVRVGLDERDALRFFYRDGFTRPTALEPTGGMYDDDFIALTLEKTVPERL